MHDFHLHKIYTKGQMIELSRKAKMEALADEVRQNRREERQHNPVIKTVRHMMTTPLRVVAVFSRQAFSRQEALEFVGRSTDLPVPNTQS